MAMLRPYLTHHPAHNAGQAVSRFKEVPLSGVKGRSGRRPSDDQLHCKNVMRRALTDETVIAVFRTLARHAQAGSVAHAKLLLAYLFGRPKALDDPLDGLTPEKAKALVDFRSRMATLELRTVLDLLDRESGPMDLDPDPLPPRDPPPPLGEEDSSDKAASW